MESCPDITLIPVSAETCLHLKDKDAEIKNDSSSIAIKGTLPEEQKSKNICPGSPVKNKKATEDVTNVECNNLSGDNQENDLLIVNHLKLNTLKTNIHNLSKFCNAPDEPIEVWTNKNEEEEKYFSEESDSTGKESLEDADSQDSDKQEEREISCKSLTSDPIISLSGSDLNNSEEETVLLAAVSDPWPKVNNQHGKFFEDDPLIKKEDKTIKNKTKKNRKSSTSKSAEASNLASEVMTFTEKEKKKLEELLAEDHKEYDGDTNAYGFSKDDQKTIDDIDQKLKQLYEGSQYNLDSPKQSKVEEICLNSNNEEESVEEEYCKAKECLQKIEHELYNLKGLLDSELSHSYMNAEKLNDLLSRCLNAANVAVEGSEIIEKKLLNTSCPNTVLQSGEKETREVRSFRRQSDSMNSDNLTVESMSDDKIQEVLKNPRLTSKALGMGNFTGYAARRSPKFISVNKFST